MKSQRARAEWEMKNTARLPSALYSTCSQTLSGMPYKGLQPMNNVKQAVSRQQPR